MSIPAGSFVVWVGAAQAAPDHRKEPSCRRNRRLRASPCGLVQGILAALFLFAGGSKLAIPVAELSRWRRRCSGSFLKFIGVCELLGALGSCCPGCSASGSASRRLPRRASSSSCSAR
jgi:hypothetical protein